MEAGGREFRLHGRVAKGVGHLGHDEAMEAGGREFRLHGRMAKGVGHLGHDEAMEAGGRANDTFTRVYLLINLLINKLINKVPLRAKNVNMAAV